MSKIILSQKASEQLEELKSDHAQVGVVNDIIKTLHFMEENLRHPSLNTHEYKGSTGPNGEKLFEAYVEQKTPHAYRIFWYYGHEQETIIVTAIIPHPK